MYRFIVLTLLICMSIMGGVSGSAAGSAAGSGALDLTFRLPVPQDKGLQTDLGIPSADSFTLDQVKADILVIEIFSMYCPICQREAPQVNELYRMLRNHTGKSIRLIGIGAGNSEFEVNFFKETYGIEFPLFSDGKFFIHKKVGEKGTPFFIGLKPGNPKGSRVFFTHSGDIKDLDGFFNRLLEASD